MENTRQLKTVFGKWKKPPKMRTEECVPVFQTGDHVMYSCEMEGKTLCPHHSALRNQGFHEMRTEECVPVFHNRGTSYGFCESDSGSTDSSMPSLCSGHTTDDSESDGSEPDLQTLSRARWVFDRTQPVDVELDVPQGVYTEQRGSEIACSRDNVTKDSRVLRWSQELNGRGQTLPKESGIYTVVDDVVTGQSFGHHTEQADTDAADSISRPRDRLAESAAPQETEIEPEDMEGNQGWVTVSLEEVTVAADAEPPAVTYIPQQSSWR
jgi:hypothetical protein